ncbi:oligosaccharyl transferase, archaeosortase A system-associated [Halomicrobium salinisoli]|uniref:oligosaccharyl transferase, archaeosortase A system-associated n=1 Tax=Halomicrobium salinisoli TaxID=2878391 RepID=UPI001CF0157F|nr:oligosaccharyl transferase, archaeosortase A system-associated [Halomicrobium salinisoli]
MAERTERDGWTVDATPLLEFVRRLPRVPSYLLLAMAFMFWVRAQSYRNFLGGDGTVRLTAIDSWYHWRTTMYTVRNWPRTMPYDPWTAYPTGTYVGQFGTLFDQIVATAALIVGGGDPSQETVLTVALLAVPAIAALVAIPTYFVCRRLGGWVGGMLGVVLLALFPGRFIGKSTAGMYQHHAAEVLFMTVAVLAAMVALTVAERERPRYEDVADREWRALRRPAGYAALAGLAVALYLWVWPPGVVLVAIFGLFFAIELSARYVGGGSPEPLAFVGAVALGVTGLLTTATMEVTEVHPAAEGPLQPALALAVAGGCVFMVGLARAWERRGIDRRYYPVAVAAGIVVAAAAIALVLPSVWERILRGVYGRLIPVGYSATALTVAEAGPPDDVLGFFYEQYGPAFLTGLVGLAALAARSVLGDDHRAEHVLIVVWALVLTSMAVTQQRFNYYYVAPVAALNAVLVGEIVGGIDRGDLPRVRVVDVGRVAVLLGLAAVVLLPLTTLVPPATVLDAGGDQRPSRDAMRWQSTNHWLEANSPAPGAWGGANNADEFDYYGTYPVPEDGDFAYPEGAYGVMSWWDYGHFITVQAERIPHANPFQQNARSAAAFFTADSEERAQLVLEAIPAAEKSDDLNRLDEGELAALADERTAQERGEGSRYVVIDDEMAGHKFESMRTYAGEDADAYRADREVQVVEDASTVSGTVTAPTRDEAFEETVLSRLYFDDADGMEHYRLVHNDDQQSQFVTVAVSRDGGETWEPEYVNRPVTQRVLDTLDRLQADPDAEVAVYDLRMQPAVKVFERVEGAELTGTVDAPAGSTVTAELRLTTEQRGRTFTYEQTATVGEDGSFSMTVPYATREDVDVEEGYTDSSVTADGPYAIRVDGEVVATAEVDESALYAGETGEVAMRTE